MKTTSPTSSPKTLSGTIDTVPGDGYGYITTDKSWGESINIIGSDTITSSGTTFGSNSVAYFGNQDTVGGISLNGKNYAVWTAPDGPQTQYELPATNDTCIFYTEGTNNIFTYTVAGNTWHDTVNAAIGTMSLSSPSFGQKITKSSGLTITWSTSSYDSDYIIISLSGKLPMPAAGDTSNNHLQYGSDSSFYVITSDNGSYTIPSSVLTAFPESQATLAITREAWKEVTHGDKKYVFTVTTGNTIDVYLQ